MRKRLGVRWTIGDVSARGFRALGLSIRGARRVFGDDAEYVVCVNTVAVDAVRRQAGPIPEDVVFEQVDAAVPALLLDRFDDRFAEGVGWKLAPPRRFPNQHELALDNDCILWRMPEGIRRWLEDPEGVLLAEDVVPAFGRFWPWCPSEPRNSGIRGLPPGLDLLATLEPVLARVTDPLDSELDEQGLQVAALSQDRAPHLVRVDEVTICSPFPPHLLHLGTCGVHFVGVNAKRMPWSHAGRPGHAWIRDHFDRLRPEVEARVAGPLVTA